GGEGTPGVVGIGDETPGVVGIGGSPFDTRGGAPGVTGISRGGNIGVIGVAGEPGGTGVIGVAEPMIGPQHLRALRRFSGIRRMQRMQDWFYEPPLPAYPPPPEFDYVPY